MANDIPTYFDDQGKAIEPSPVWDMAATSLLADNNRVKQVGTTMSKFVEGFAGAAYAAGAASIAALTDPTTGKWDIARNVAGMTITLANGSLTVAMGTTNGAELLMIARQPCTIPQNLVASFSASQRIAGNEIRVGYLEVDVNGNLVANPSLANFANNMASIRLDGTVNTSIAMETVEDGIGAARALAVAGQLASTAIIDYALELRPEDATYTQQASDSSAARASATLRISTVNPNPNKLYRPFIWLRNVSAPATTTSVVFSRFISMDIQEIQAEIGGGRGNLSASQSIPVANSTGAPIYVQAISGGVAMGIVATYLSATGANGNQESKHKLLSAATGNPTSVKTSAGRVQGGIIQNLSAATFYFKLFNKASAPTLGTDVPVLTFAVRAGQDLMLSQLAQGFGLLFTTGIAYAITAAYADLDTTAIAAGDALLDLFYI